MKISQTSAIFVVLALFLSCFILLFCVFMDEPEERVVFGIGAPVDTQMHEEEEIQYYYPKNCNCEIGEMCNIDEASGCCQCCAAGCREE